MPVYPGFHQDFELFLYPDTIRPAIRKIAANFYITRGFKRIQIGNSSYWAILARPTDEFSIYVNTDREILILFSEYETFEFRTLDAYEEFYDLLESRRIDQSLRFLISGDSRIEAMIRHYLDQHPEYPIIIPATFRHLEREGNSLLAAVRRNYLLRDLFGYQNPLREETFFFGRQLVVNSVLDMARSGQNSSLFGLRKSGKTSLIYAVQRKAKGFLCNVAVIDCQNPAVHARRYDSLLAYVIGEVRRSFGQKKALPLLGDALATISENFSLYMSSALSAAKNTVLLIFDEIENISPKTAASPHWREGHDTLYFWQILRSYIQSESRGRLSVCIVGTSPHILEVARIIDVANPIYLYAQKRFIPNFTFDETREMVERLGYFMGLEFPAEVITDLQREFGGHPFFTRQVCSKVHQLASADRPLKVSRAALQRAKTEFYGQLESYLRDIVQHLEEGYPEEFKILSAVVQGDKSELTEYGREAPDLIDHLIGYGLVERVGEDFDIRFDAIKIVLQRLIGPDAVQDRWKEISGRRNALETEIRIALYHWCKGVPTTEWNRILSSALTNKRREALSTTEPGVLFSSKQSPLFLTDLLMLLKDFVVLPFLGERRTTIISFLDVINKLRKDAHALEPSNEDMVSVRSAFDYLEAEFCIP